MNGWITGRGQSNGKGPLSEGALPAGTDHQQKQPLWLPPQQHSRRTIQIQSHPPQKLEQLCSQHPLPKPQNPPLPPQQHRIRISQIMLPPLPPVLQLQLQLQSHPQFVAAKSLMLVPPKDIYT
jgi:hypothetical protein